MQCCEIGADGDIDGDGVFDCADFCPFDGRGSDQVATEDPGCFEDAPQNPDGDGDTINDEEDSCPTAFASPEDLQLSGLPLGCPCLDRFDADGDGLFNCQEDDDDVLIPTGGVCEDDGDADNDGLENCFDPCPEDGLKTSPLVCGCNIVETPNCLEPCITGFRDLGCGCGLPDCLSVRSTENFLTNRTKLISPPDVQIIPLDEGRFHVLVSFRRFTGARRIRRSRNKVTTSQATLERMNRRRRNRLRVRYQVVLRRVQGNRKRIVERRIVRSSMYLIRRLNSGIYSLRYRALVRTRRTKNRRALTVSRTNVSPARTFTL